MTIESLPTKRAGVRLRSEAIRTLRELPPRRPQDPPAASATVRWELLDIDRYVVRGPSGVAGFIDVVGAVFVVLSGARYDRAVEVMQTLDFMAGVARLHASSHRPVAGPTV